LWPVLAITEDRALSFSLIFGIGSCPLGQGPPGRAA